MFKDFWCDVAMCKTTSLFAFPVVYIYHTSTITEVSFYDMHSSLHGAMVQKHNQ